MGKNYSQGCFSLFGKWVCLSYVWLNAYSFLKFTTMKHLFSLALCLVLWGTAQAQTTFCTATATSQGRITPTSTPQTVIGLNGSEPYWTFTATAGTTYTFSTCGAGFDTYLRIYAVGANTTTALNDDNGPLCSGTAASLVWQATTTGDYEILLTRFSCVPLTADVNLQYYTTRLPVTFCTSDTVNGGVLLPTAAVQNVTAPSGSASYYQFTASGSSTEFYQFSTCGATANTQLQIFRTGSTSVASNDDNGPLCSGTAASLNFSTTIAGTYYLLVSESSCGRLTDPVVLRYNVTQFPTCTADTVSGGSLTPTVASQTALAPAGPAVIYRFDAVAGEVLNFSTCGATTNTQLTIYRQGVATVQATNDDNGPSCTGTAASLNFSPTVTGTYFLLLTETGCTRLTAPVTLSYNSTFVPFCDVNAVNAGRITVNSLPQTVVGRSGTTAYWTFDATAGVEYVFSTCGAGFDTYLRIYDSASRSNTPVALNDDNGPECSGTAASMRWTPTLSGTYQIHLARFSCVNLTADVTLTYSSVGGVVGQLFCNPAAALATTITPTATIQTVTGTAGSIPYWSFNADSAMSYRFSTCGANSNTFLRVHSPTNQTPLATNDDNGFACTGTAASLDFIAPRRGTYFVLLTDAVCDPLSAPVSLTYQRVDPTFCTLSPTNAGNLPLSTTTQNVTGQAGTSPYWSFSASPNFLYRFSTCGANNNTYLRIVRTLGPAPLAENDDNGVICSGTAASLEWTPTTAGTYFVLLTDAPCAPLSANTTLSYTEVDPLSFPFCNAAAADQGTLSMSVNAQTINATSGTAPYWSFFGFANFRYTFGTCGASNNTVLRIYRQGAANTFAINDDNGPLCTGTAASLQYDVTTAGTYYIMVSDAGCNALTGNVSLTYQGVRLTSLSRAIEEPRVKIYPNPSSGQITLEWQRKDARQAQYEVYDLQGKKVAAASLTDISDVSESRVNLSQLPKGNYMFRLVANGTSEVHSLILQ